MLAIRLRKILMLAGCLAWVASPASAGVTALSTTDPGLYGDTAAAQSGPQLSAPESPLSMSGDGRWVAFLGQASHLAPLEEPAPKQAHVYLRDRWTGATILVSRAAGTAGRPANGASSRPVVSRDGSFVVFVSRATDLVSGQTDANNANDVFLYDRTADTVTLVSRSTAGAATTGNQASDSPAIDDDGSWIAFASAATNLAAGLTDTNSAQDVFLFERATGARTLVSRTAASSTTAGNRKSQEPTLSGDGAFVAFSSSASNLVTGQTDTNNNDDIFLWDRAAGTTALVSHTTASAVTAPASYSVAPAVTWDGAFVVFQSLASSGLVAGQTDTNGGTDIFLWERATGGVTLVSHTSASLTTAGSSSSSLAMADGTGSRVAFRSFAGNLVAGDFNGQADVFLWDRATGANQIVGYASSNSGDRPSLSGDGRFVAFQHATRTVSGVVDANATLDVYLYDATSATLEFVSRASSGSTTANGASTLPVISADGAAVAFVSAATDLVAGIADTNSALDVFGWERASGLSDLVSARDASLPSATASGASRVGNPAASVSADGQRAVFLSFAGNVAASQSDLSTEDLFLWDGATGVRFLVSRAVGTATSSNGTPRSPAISADGGTVVFNSNATNLLTGVTDSNLTDDIFAYDPATGTVTLVSRTAASATTAANSASVSPAASADGRWVAFLSYATNLVTGQTDTNGGTDVFLHDRQTGTTLLVSHTAASATTAGGCSLNAPVISADGNWVAFTSFANNLVSGVTDTNSKLDIFLYSRASGAITLVSHTAASAMTAAGNTSQTPVINADGSRVAFVSLATNLIAGFTDSNFSSASDVFLFDRATGANTLVSRSSASATQAGNGGSQTPTISADGAWVAFTSLATNLVTSQSDANGGADVFLYGSAAGTTTLVSRTAASATATGNNVCTGPVVSADGTRVAFASYATNLVTGQSEPAASTQDVFLFDRPTGTTLLASQDLLSATTAGNASSSDPAIDEHGLAVAFTTGAANLAADDFNGNDDAVIFHDVP